MSVNDLFCMTESAALIVGGTSGIGFATAQQLLLRGCSVVVTGTSEATVGKAVSSLSQLAPGRVHGLTANLGDKATLQGLIARSTDLVGSFRHFVCCAGIDQSPSSIGELSEEEWSRLFSANVFATSSLADSACEVISQSGEEGCVVVIGSASAFRGVDTYGAYAMSKATLANLVQHLAVRWGPYGVRANCVAPSLIRTKFSMDLWADEVRLREVVRNNYPLKRIGEPTDVAGLVVALLSPAGRWTTGQTLIVDGGMTAALGCFAHKQWPAQGTERSYRREHG
jgi:NAD(P)-dependent dehydrogenase (short-subunit alcohol dehydrogenase family)